MKVIDSFRLIVILFFLISSLSCCNVLIDPDIKDYVEKNGWRNKVDDDIHRYNITKDTTILYNTLTFLQSMPINNDNQIFLQTRELTVLRLLHKYDRVFAILDACPNDAMGNFGKMKQYLITEISQYNYYQQFDVRDQKINQLVSYMEYCFERQNLVDEKDESRYLQTYKDNKLAMCAVATETNAYSLNWYLGVRLLRGDKKSDIKGLIENYYQMGYITVVGKDWLESLLEGNYDEKDIDSTL